jgi:hypothetical protein
VEWRENLKKTINVDFTFIKEIRVGMGETLEALPGE